MTIVNLPGSSGFLFQSTEEALNKRLRDNPEQFTDLQLWLNSDTNLKDLNDAILHNRTIREVCLLIHESFQQHSAKDILRLFRALGALPQLKKLLFNTYRFPFVATLPIQAFTNAFQGSHNTLTEFKLWRCDLSLLSEEDGSPIREMERCANALNGAKNLKVFRLVKCTLTEETRKLCTLDPILQALTHLPCLQEMELSATEFSALGTISKSTLRSLFRSTSLLELNLRHFYLDEESILEIAYSLFQYHDIDNHHRKSQKEQEDHQHPAYCHRHKPSKIQSLSMSGITKNQTSTGSVMISKPVREAFQKVLRSNYTLETLFLFDTWNLKSEIEFYTKLNRLGRNRLLQDHKATRQEWIDLLVQIKDDLDCLFYFLSMNPLLCSSQEDE